VIREKKKKGKIFVISGPSGSGKTTLLERLLKDKGLKKKLAKSISLTTRQRRSGERSGKHYFFISESELKERLRAKKILEWTRYLGYYYATPKGFVERELRKGKNLALCLDLKGALQIKRIYPKNAVTIFIAPPSIEELRQRIKGRCSKTKQEEIMGRLELASEEMLEARRYDYSLVNEDLTQAQKMLKDIILREII